jgi:hypothetical protein
MIIRISTHSKSTRRRLHHNQYGTLPSELIVVGLTTRPNQRNKIAPVVQVEILRWLSQQLPNNLVPDVDIGGPIEVPEVYLESEKCEIYIACCL